MPGPLHGYRIVDLTSMISGPLATMILADQGADVIKVENPDGGDHTRAANNRRNGFSASFLNNNRNKRSVALDLKQPAAKEALLQLIETADVLVQNFRPGVAERMGLGEDAVRAVAPRIVYVSISGFGEIGPYSQKPVYDPLIQAVSGLASIQAGSDTERPRLVRTIVPDKLTGVTAAQAITAALLARERTGQGPARAPVDAGCGDRVPLGLRHGQPDFRRRGHSAAGGRQFHRPDLRDGDNGHQRRGPDQQGMAGADAGTGYARVAAGSALPDPCPAPTPHR